MTPPRAFDSKSALAFVVAFGFVSLFADAAYEGMRGISGPFLASLGATGAMVGVIAGGGELAGYLLRLGSGRWAERSGAFWGISLFGYAIQMAAVPALALAHSWQAAAFFIVAERAGKAIRNPPRDVMLSRAGSHIGQGWAFGLHEAMDQTGACAGPLIAALVLAHHGDYRAAFLWLGVPAALTLLAVFGVRLRFGYAGSIAPHPAGAAATGLSRAFWLYAIASALVGFGFADYPLIAFHFAKAAVVPQAGIALFYAAGMLASGAGSLLFGRWFDARGLVVLVPGLLIGALVAPLAFYGGFALALAGVLLWGVAQGVHEAVMNAAVAVYVPEHLRARAYGLFSAIYGIAWFAGSALLGLLYDRSLAALVAVAVAAPLIAFVPLIAAMKAQRSAG